MAVSEVSDVVERLMRYCSIPSPSDALSQSEVPSSPEQHTMSACIADDLRELGAEDVSIDEHAYVIAHWPASVGSENLPTLGFCCHVDTVRQAHNAPVCPQIVTYQGGRCVIGHDSEGNEVAIGPKTNPQLAQMVGEQLICADGSTLLGGDDKAGCAEIISLLARLKDNPSLPHPRLAVAFVPDEEIGHGASLLDLERFGARWGYTIDGGPMGEFCYETFNAAEAHLKARGVSVHTGTAKGLMINAAECLMHYNELLPAQDRPEYTEGRDGFYYLERISGNCEAATADYIIRDHDAAKFAQRKQLMQNAVDYFNQRIDAEVLSIDIHDQYHNLADIVLLPENVPLIERAHAAYKTVGYEMKCIPMRGGTDGSQLSFRGFACANLSACYYNAHGPMEFVPVGELESMVDMLQELVALYAQPHA